MSNVAAQLNNLNDLEAQIAALKAQAAEIKKVVKTIPRLKVSQKGAISVYGLQRMPVTLYAGQWERIIELVNSGVFADFIAQNEATLTRKGEDPKTEAAPTVAEAPAPKKTKKTKKTARRSEGPTDDELNAIDELDGASRNARSSALAALSAKVDAMDAAADKTPAFDIFED